MSEIEIRTKNTQVREYGWLTFQGRVKLKVENKDKRLNLFFFKMFKMKNTESNLQ